MNERARFAPSPTGPLHIGSLTTAVASWLDARANGRHWFVRIEDLDTPREVAGASATILHQLRAHGLWWNHWEAKMDERTPSLQSIPLSEGVLFQHQRHSAYQMALYRLIAKGQAYPCTCSRKRLQIAVDHGKTTHNPDGEILYPGFCRPPQLKSRTLQEAIEWFTELDQPGTCWRYFNENQDDFILRRADGFWAYHHAVVVDDAYQEITHILRGDDLLHAIPRHAALRNTLGFNDPVTMHIPVIRNDLGEKLSKQNHAPAVRTDHPEICRLQLECAWSHLELHMPIGWITRMRAPFERQLIEPLRRLD